ncbi:hypothetical protein SAMN04487934_101313 [Eubacterium ruminantium]|nr:hypothetical protein SAMN04487934_101313 [Eubacterium ruminantium]
MRKRFKGILAAVSAAVFFAGAFTKGVKADGWLTPESSNNVNKHEYSWYMANPINSYIEGIDGGYERVEFISGNVVIENYDSNFNCYSYKKKQAELPLFGGFYSGAVYNYIVYGQNNPDESDEKEVIRIVKYDKKWNRLDSCSFYGANTEKPFQAGTLRMDESGDHLVIRTCHTMYQSDDGYNHQANIMIKMKTSTMEIIDSFTDVANLNSGYVSHSFNQFVKIDNENIIAVDHGDAYPRQVVIGKYSNTVTSPSLGRYSNTSLCDISGSVGANYTGVSVGGFEISESGYLTALSSVKMGDSYNSSGIRNIKVVYTDKNLSNVNTVQLTDYAEGGSETASNPFLVKISDNLFTVIWQEKNSQQSQPGVYYAFVDGTGKKKGSVGFIPNLKLSDCDPKYIDGKIVWYVTQSGVNSGTPVFYRLTPNITAYSFTCDTFPKKSVSVPEYTKSFTYDGNVKTAVAGGDDYNVTNGSATNAGTYTATISLKDKNNTMWADGTTEDKKFTWVINAWGISDKVKVYLGKKIYDYDGTAKKPSVKVVLGDEVLTKGKDYSVTYSNNTNAGKALARIIFKGNYSGSYSYSYIIKPSISEQPQDRTAFYGNNARFTVAAGGGELSYQWQVSKDGQKWMNSSAKGNQTASILFKATKTTNGRMFRCKITGGDITIYSNIVTLTTRSNIVTQPVNVSVAKGKTATFSLKAAGANLSYQWQVYVEGKGWKNSGATGNTTNKITFTASAKMNGYKFRCIVTNGTEKVVSNTVTLTVK